MAYLTDRYRRAAYIMSALERERRTGCSSNVSRIELTTRLLIAELEEAFKNKQVLKDLGTFFKVGGKREGFRTLQRKAGCCKARVLRLYAGGSVAATDCQADQDDCCQAAHDGCCLLRALVISPLAAVQLPRTWLAHVRLFRSL